MRKYVSICLMIAITLPLFPLVQVKTQGWEPDLIHRNK